LLKKLNPDIFIALCKLDWDANYGCELNLDIRLLYMCVCQLSIKSFRHFKDVKSLSKTLRSRILLKASL